MRDLGAEPILDFSSNNLENNVESIIRELRNVLRDSIVEGAMGIFLFVGKLI